MARYDGLPCPACGRMFETEDDIVVCPVCGTPHHRACWQTRGACAHSEKHALGFQWERPHTVLPAEFDEKTALGMICPRCGHNSPRDAKFCPACGLPFGDIHAASASGGQARPVLPPAGPEPPLPGGIPLFNGAYFAAYGPGVSSGDTIDGNPVREVTEVVQFRSESYLPKFLRMERLQKKVSWNWAAFFFPRIWFCYRKLYKVGAVILALFFALSLFFVKPMTEFTRLNSHILTASLEAMEQEDGNGDAVQAAQQTLLASPALKYVALYYGLTLALAVFSGLLGNYFYKRDIRRRIGVSRRQAEDDEAFHFLLLRRGGVSLLGALLAFFLPELAGMLVTMLV